MPEYDYIKTFSIRTLVLVFLQMTSMDVMCKVTIFLSLHGHTKYIKITLRSRDINNTLQ